MTQPGPRVVTGRVESTGTLADFVGPSILTAGDVDFASATSVYQVMLHVAQANLSGILGFQTEDGMIAISCSDGLVIKSSSDQESEDESLALTIMDENLLAREKLVRAAEHSDKTGQDLARSLFGLQLMTPREMVRAFKTMHQRHCSTALRSASAQFTFAPGEVLGGKGLKGGPTHLPIRKALAEELRTRSKSSHAHEIDGVLQPLRQHFLAIPSEVAEIAGNLGFNKREIHAMETLFDGSQRMDAILRASVLSRSAMNKLLLVCGALGVITLLDESTKPIEIKTRAQRLEELFNELVSKDHFDRIGTHWSTSFLQIDKAYRRRMAQFGPEGKDGRAPETAEVAGRIWGLISEAWDVLRERESRMAYRDSFVEPDQKRYSAELLLAQARTAELQREFTEAREQLDTAYELVGDPQYLEARKKIDAYEREWIRKTRLREGG